MYVFFTLRSGKNHKHWFNVSVQGGDINELAWFTGLQRPDPPPSSASLKCRNVSKQLWRNEASFTEITCFWQFDTHSEPLFLKTNDLLKFRSFTKQYFESDHHYRHEPQGLIWFCLCMFFDSQSRGSHWLPLYDCQRQTVTVLVKHFVCSTEETKSHLPGGKMGELCL